MAKVQEAASHIEGRRRSVLVSHVEHAVGAVRAHVGSVFRTTKYPRGTVELARILFAKWAIDGTHPVIDGVPHETWWKRRYRRQCAHYALAVRRSQRRTVVSQGVGILCGAMLWVLVYLVFAVSDDVRPWAVPVSVISAIVTVTPFLVASTRLRHRWAPYLIGAIFNYLLGCVVAAAAGHTLWDAITPFGPGWASATLVQAAHLNALLLLVGLGLAAGAQVHLIAEWNVLRRKHAPALASVDAMYVASNLTRLADGPTRMTWQETVHLVNWVERVADRVHDVARSARGVRSPAARSALETRLDAAANHLRSLAADLAVPSAQTVGELAPITRRIALCLVVGWYGHLPEAATLAGEHRSRVKAMLRGIRFVVVTALPIAAVTIGPLIGLDIPAIATQWLNVFVLVWVLVRVLVLIDPNYRTSLTGAREIVNEVRGLAGSNF